MPVPYSQYYYILFKAEHTLCNFLSERDENLLIHTIEKSLKSITSKKFYKYVNSISKEKENHF